MRLILGELLVKDINIVGNLQYFPQKTVPGFFGDPTIQQRCSVRAYIPFRNSSVILDLIAWAELVDPLLEIFIEDRAFNAVLSPTVISSTINMPEGVVSKKVRFTIMKFI